MRLTELLAVKKIVYFSDDCISFVDGICLARLCLIIYNICYEEVISIKEALYCGNI